MKKVSDDIIKQIAENVDKGERCFIHIKTLEIVSYPDDDGIEITDEINQAIEKIDSDYDNYFEFEPMSSKDSFAMMREFTNAVDDTELKYLLTKAIGMPKPFQNFKKVIDTVLHYKESWHTFKEVRYFDMIKKQLEQAS